MSTATALARLSLALVVQGVVAIGVADHAELIQVQRSEDRLQLGLGQGAFAQGLEHILLEDTLNWFEVVRARRTIPHLEPPARVLHANMSAGGKTFLVQMLKTVSRAAQQPTPVNGWDEPKDNGAQNLGRWIALGGLILDFIMLMSSAVGIECMVLTVLVYYGLGVLFLCFYQLVSIPDAIVQLAEMIAGVGYGSFPASCTDDDTVLDCNMKRIFHSFHSWVGLLLVWKEFTNTVDFTLAKQARMLVTRWKNSKSYLQDWTKSDKEFDQAVRAVVGGDVYTEFWQGTKYDSASKMEFVDKVLDLYQTLASATNFRFTPCGADCSACLSETDEAKKLSLLLATLEEAGADTVNNWVHKFCVYHLEQAAAVNKTPVRQPRRVSCERAGFFSGSKAGLEVALVEGECVVTPSFDLGEAKDVTVKLVALQTLVENRILRRASRLVMVVNFLLAATLVWVAFTKDMRDADHYVTKELMKIQAGLWDKAPMSVVDFLKWVDLGPLDDDGNIVLDGEAQGLVETVTGMSKDNYAKLVQKWNENSCIGNGGNTSEWNRYCNYKDFTGTSPAINGFYLLLITFSGMGYGDLTAMSQWAEVASGFILPAGVALSDKMVDLGKPDFAFDVENTVPYSTLLRNKLQGCLR
jgi:hypothetical protein